MWVRRACVTGRDGGVRSLMFTALEPLQRPSSGHALFNTSIESASVTAATASEHAVANAARVTARSAGLMLQADVCLTPVGDTFSSRRLYDALAAGCVPMIIDAPEGSPEGLPDGGQQQRSSRGLPFANLIDWGSIVFYHQVRAPTRPPSHISHPLHSAPAHLRYYPPRLDWPPASMNARAQNPHDRDFSPSRNLTMCS